MNNYCSSCNEYDNLYFKCFFCSFLFCQDCYKNLMSNVLCLKICDVCRNKYIVKKYG